jgi:general secretion pathway protein H
MAQTSATGTDAAATPGARACSGGFTLVEVLIALAIIALLAAALSPMLLPSPARTLNNAAGELVVALRESRRQAQSSRQPRHLLIDTASKRFAIEASNDWRALPEHSTAEVTTAQSLIARDDLAAIAFFPDGSSSGGRIRLGLEGHAAQIDVEWLTGRIMLTDTRP